MNVASIASDDELAIGPLGIFVSADQEFEGELFEDGVVHNVKFNFGKCTKNSAWLGDVSLIV